VRWPQGVTCPACGSRSISRIVKRHVFDCNDCRRQFSVTSGTIFHDSHLSLRTWFLAIHRISESKKGVSALQLKRELNVAYKTAWYLCHRIRQAMGQPSGPGLRGIIEVDETYIRGEGVPPDEDLKRGRGSQRCTPVVGMKQRKGLVRAKALPHLRDSRSWVHQNIAEDGVTAVFSDATNLYDDLDATYTHGKIDHSLAYVLGDLHTNGIESFWSLFKRGVTGSYHHVSRKHLQRYLDEYCWRSNGPTEDIFESLLGRQAKCHPLTYDTLISKRW